jgi:two-component system sensor histidine kinase BaeS
MAVRDYPAWRMDNWSSNRLRLRLRVVHKLFLLLAVLIVLALGLLAGSTALNLRRGFVNYINTLDLQRLQPLAQALEQRADATAGFGSLRDRLAWEALLHDTLDVNHPRPALPPPPPPPPPASAPPPPPPVPLPGRVSLLDTRHRWIAGPRPEIDALQLRLQRDGRTLGWLSLRPLRQPAGSQDIDFLASQLHDLFWIALGLLLLALVVAWIFARHLLAPLREVESAAQRLADGHHPVRLQTSRRDELGDLVRHINRLSAALRAHESARRRWIADISHELRTPLSIVRGEIEAMQEGMRRVDERALRSLHDEVMRLNRLVDDLHQLSMADLGTLDYRLRSFDLADLLRGACSHFEIEARAAGLTLECSLRPSMVRADPDRLRQLFDNLLHNSVRYTDPGGCIRVVCRSQTDGVYVLIDDTAPGVSADALPRLFEPLYRGEVSRDRRRGGSGLGLAIAERIAQAHGGALHASPSPLGGLRIELVLPARDA